MKNGLVVLVFLMLLGISSSEQLPRDHEIQNEDEVCCMVMFVEPNYTPEELELLRISESISAIWMLPMLQKIGFGMNLDGVGWSDRIRSFYRKGRPYHRKGLRKVQIRRLNRRIRRLVKALEACETEQSIVLDVESLLARWG